MKVLNIALGLIALTTALPALADDPCRGGEQAGEQCIAASMAPNGGDFTPIYVRLDASGNLVGMRIAPNKVFSPSQLKNGADLMIHGHSGVLKMTARNFNTSTGGQLELRFDPDILNVFGSSKTITLGMSRGGDGQWRLSYGGHNVTKLVMQPASRGISNVSPIAILANQPDKTLEQLLPATNKAAPSVEEDRIMVKTDVKSDNLEGVFGVDGVSPTESTERPTQVAI